MTDKTPTVLLYMGEDVRNKTKEELIEILEELYESWLELLESKRKEREFIFTTFMRR